MAQGRKYTNLPDLDTSPDIYESHETATSKSNKNDSSSSTPASSANSETDSAISDLDDPPQKASRITRQTLSTAAARSHFKDSRVDARGVDFSDRITNGRKSYRVPKSRRRRLRRGEHGYVDEYEFESDEEESFEERIARLKREIEEVRVEGEKRANGGAATKASHSIEELSSLLSTIQEPTRISQPPRQLVPAVQVSKEPLPQSTPPSANVSTVDLRPILHKTTAFESRLTLLESALGLSSLTSIQSSVPPQPNNVLTTLSKLETQLETLSSTTLPGLDNMASHIHNLTTEAERLSEIRSEAKAARDAASVLSPSSQARFLPSSAPESIDPEIEARISSIHASLENISQLSPLLPAVLDRLKSLRVLHADAATVSERFGEAERLQAQLGAEIERWKQALEGLQGRVREVETVESGNKEVVEAWVKKLEGRIDELNE